MNVILTAEAQRRGEEQDIDCGQINLILRLPIVPVELCACATHTPSGTNIDLNVVYPAGGSGIFGTLSLHFGERIGKIAAQAFR